MTSNSARTAASDAWLPGALSQRRMQSLMSSDETTRASERRSLRQAEIWPAFIPATALRALY